MAKSPEEIAAAMIAGLKEKTGKSMEEWRAILAPMADKKHGELVSHLKSEHGVTHGFANMIVHEMKKSAAHSADGDDLVATQYEGKKAGLRPIYDELERRIKSFGSDVEFSPKKTYVSVRRSKQFALIQPSTATRLDVGLNLKGTPPTGRLEASGSFNAMVSHRVRVESPEHVDDELIGWLRAAYDNA